MGSDGEGEEKAVFEVDNGEFLAGGWGFHGEIIGQPVDAENGQHRDVQLAGCGLGCSNFDTKSVGSLLLRGIRPDVQRHKNSCRFLMK